VALTTASPWAVAVYHYLFLSRGVEERPTDRLTQLADKIEFSELGTPLSNDYYVGSPYS
jgi:hypothetical protein